MTQDLDVQLAQLVRRSRRIVWAVIATLAVVLVFALAAIGYLVQTTSSQRAEIVQLLTAAAEQRAQIQAGLCSFDRDLAGAPLTVIPATGRPGELAVSIVADSHNAYVDIGCPGQLPVNAPLMRWAAFYHVPLHTQRPHQP
jgi:hypothetical protein